jgi:hypothetical protein
MKNKDNRHGKGGTPPRVAPRLKSEVKNARVRNKKHKVGVRK